MLLGQTDGEGAERWLSRRVRQATRDQRVFHGYTAAQSYCSNRCSNLQQPHAVSGCFVKNMCATFELKPPVLEGP